MSLDGIFLNCLRAELENIIIDARVDKVFEPSKEELILSLRTRGQGTKKLLLCARANSPRVSFTEQNYENPASPPMLCMLLRKRLGGAAVTGVRQEGCDRILYIDFLATNEMGEKEKLTLVCEIMAQYSNVILI
ncbi:MAG: NFACT family protein, partial [Clostridia bacterium]|nr:NFACT family protein [Clostridia bacterium]